MSIKSWTIAVGLVCTLVQGLYYSVGTWLIDLKETQGLTEAWVNLIGGILYLTLLVLLPSGLCYGRMVPRLGSRINGIFCAAWMVVSTLGWFGLYLCHVYRPVHPVYIVLTVFAAAMGCTCACVPAINAIMTFVPAEYGTVVVGIACCCWSLMGLLVAGAYHFLLDLTPATRLTYIFLAYTIATGVCVVLAPTMGMGDIKYGGAKPAEMKAIDMIKNRGLQVAMFSVFVWIGAAVNMYNTLGIQAKALGGTDEDDAMLFVVFSVVQTLSRIAVTYVGYVIAKNHFKQSAYYRLWILFGSLILLVVLHASAILWDTVAGVYVLSALVGVSYGTSVVLLVAFGQPEFLVMDRKGLQSARHYVLQPVLYGFTVSAVAPGPPLFDTLSGLVYDSHANADHVCHGAICFRFYFLVVLCLLALPVLAVLWLIRREKHQQDYRPDKMPGTGDPAPPTESSYLVADKGSDEYAYTSLEDGDTQ
jgi:hypothetical protein